MKFCICILRLVAIPKAQKSTDSVTMRNECGKAEQVTPELFGRVMMYETTMSISRNYSSCTNIAILPHHTDYNHFSIF